MTDNPRVQWERGPAFAEVAETVGVPTDHVMATLAERGYVLALYSEHVRDDSAIVFSVILRRDEAGILHLVRYKPVGKVADWLHSPDDLTP